MIAVSPSLAFSETTRPSLHRANVLGSSTNEWQVSATTNPTVLTSGAEVKADSEITIRFRFPNAGVKPASLYVAPGLKNADDAQQNPLFVNLHVTQATEQETVLAQMPALPGQPQGLYLPYVVRSLPKNREAWPAMVQARVEQDYASVTTLSNRWLTLRYVIRSNAAQLYLDGLLLRDTAGSGIDQTGYVRLSVFEGAQLGSVRVRSLAPEDPIFETVELDHQLNAAAEHLSPHLSPKGRGTTSNTARPRISPPLGGEDIGTSCHRVASLSSCRARTTAARITSTWGDRGCVLARWKGRSIRGKARRRAIAAESGLPAGP